MFFVRLALGTTEYPLRWHQLQQYRCTGTGTGTFMEHDLGLQHEKTCRLIERQSRQCRANWKHEGDCLNAPIYIKPLGRVFPSGTSTPTPKSQPCQVTTMVTSQQRVRCRSKSAVRNWLQHASASFESGQSFWQPVWLNSAK